ncbi:hypothetical protein [Kineococcus sp. SYSU DK003]|uniref:hypothetical protein n=1 Tax=Kineococcus sp. SYSU DK003 TaxID=3383124 RepID=UPI003D7E04C7
MNTLTVDTGVSADPELLEAAAARLAGIAADVAGAGLEVLTLAADPAFVLSAAVAPTTAAGVATAVADLLVGRTAPAAAAASLAGLAVEVRTAALRYRVGDELADAAVAVARRAVAQVVVEFAPELAAGAGALVVADHAWHTAAATERVLAAATEQAARTGTLDLDELVQDATDEFGAVDDHLRSDLAGVTTFLVAHPELVEEVVATAPHVLAAAEGRHPQLAAVLQVLAPEARDTGGVAGVAGTLTALGAVSPLFRETAVTVRPAEHARATPTRPPRGIAEVLDGVAHQSTGHQRSTGSLGDRLAPADRPAPGAVRLERITQPDGTVAWIVEIPGTQDWTPVPADGGTPMDLTTNLRAVAGEPTATAAAVTQAMRLAGVGAGEPVMLAGHSQGGLTAAALAADAAVREEFAITHVVTAGSPVDGITVPDSVAVLSLEHTGDVVPALDGSAARGSDHRTIVARDLGDDPRFATQIAADPLTAHGSTGYIATAGVVDGSADPALQRFRASGSVFFDAPGASVQAFDYYAERVG